MTNFYYGKHVFFCTNERSENHPKGCCRSKNSLILRNYMKRKTKNLGIKNIRINLSGCLDRCEHGPVMVIYPEGSWYKAKTQEDVDLIIEEHLLKGMKVKELLISNNSKHEI